MDWGFGVEGGEVGDGGEGVSYADTHAFTAAAAAGKNHSFKLASCIAERGLELSRGGG